MPFSDFDDEPTRVKPQYNSEQSKMVPAGKYDVELLTGQMKDTVGGEVFTFTGTIMNEGDWRGWNVERTIFFRRKSGSDEEKSLYYKQKFEELIKDLTVLGFDTENWTRENNRVKSSQIPLAAKAMKGLRCEFVKKEPKDPGGMANVYLNKRLAASDGRPPKLGATEMAEGAASAEPTHGASPLDEPNMPPMTSDKTPW